MKGLTLIHNSIFILIFSMIAQAMIAVHARAESDSLSLAPEYKYYRYDIHDSVNNSDAVILSNFGIELPFIYTQTSQPMTSFEKIKIKHSALDTPEGKSLDNSSLTQFEVSIGLKLRQNKAFRPIFEIGITQETFFISQGSNTIRSESMPMGFFKLNLQQDLIRKNNYLFFADLTTGLFGLSNNSNFDVRHGYLIDLAACLNYSLPRFEFGSKIHLGYSSQSSSITVQSKTDLGLAFSFKYFLGELSK